MRITEKKTLISWWCDRVFLIKQKKNLSHDTYCSGHQQVSVKWNRLKWWSEMKSFTHTALDYSDLIIKSPHLKLIFCHNLDLVVLIFSRYSPPLWIFDMKNESGRWNGHHVFEFLGNGSDGSAERLQLPVSDYKIFLSVKCSLRQMRQSYSHKFF